MELSGNSLFKEAGKKLNFLPLGEGLRMGKEKKYISLRKNN